jgi:hypothetical protein
MSSRQKDILRGIPPMAPTLRLHSFHIEASARKSFSSQNANNLSGTALAAAMAPD